MSATYHPTHFTNQVGDQVELVARLLDAYRQALARRSRRTGGVKASVPLVALSQALDQTRTALEESIKILESGE